MLCWVSGPVPDLPNQKLHFNKIPGRFICTLKCNSGVAEDELWEREKLSKNYSEKTEIKLK